MDDENIAPNTRVPDYITNMMQYNYIRISKYFMLYEFEDPITHLVILHPKMLLAATELRINLKDKFTIIAGYKEPKAETLEGCNTHLAHSAGLAIDVIIRDINKDNFIKIAESSGFNITGDFIEYIHLEVELKVPIGAKTDA